MRSLIILLAAGALAFGIYMGVHRSHSHAAVTGTSALAPPQLSLIDLNGDTLRTADYKNKVVLVNFWAAWCKPCAEEVPQFIALQKKYQNQGLQVIGFSVEDDATELRDFYRKYQMNYPVVPSDLKIADAFGGVLGLPTTFVIGRDGRIHGKLNGATNFATLEQEVVALLHTPQS
jgi:cytochrome c biogenesis protein CcmG, thiol:disulfide interchange protein DsbE